MALCPDLKQSVKSSCRLAQLQKLLYGIEVQHAMLQKAQIVDSDFSVEFTVTLRPFCYVKES